MRSTFSKRVRNLGNRLVRKWSEKDNKLSELDLRPPLWVFLNAKLVAGGPGISWNHCRPLKQQWKKKTRVLGYQGSEGVGVGTEGSQWIPSNSYCRGPRDPSWTGLLEDPGALGALTPNPSHMVSIARHFAKRCCRALLTIRHACRWTPSGSSCLRGFPMTCFGPFFLQRDRIGISARMI